MNREAYENTRDYRKAKQILREFADEKLGGDLEAMRTLCFEDVTDADPDMAMAVQAAYIILWGELYDLTFEKLEAREFRGDTMNSFGSLIGKKDRGNEFGFRAKYFGADKQPRLWEKIETFYRMYHWIGNFIVIPNRGSGRSTVNTARANYRWGMRDYFDWFLIAIFGYQDKVMRGDKNRNWFEKQLEMNPEYSPDFLKIGDWEERFFLKHYFQDGKPKLLFKTPLEKRRLITTAPENRKNENYYQDEEYLALLDDYIEKSTEVIVYRTNRMVDLLKENMK